jgi:hypothetical protein
MKQTSCRSFPRKNENKLKNYSNLTIRKKQKNKLIVKETKHKIWLMKYIWTPVNG